jgi:hypothetical protein
MHVIFCDGSKHRMLSRPTWDHANTVCNVGGQGYLWQYPHGSSGRYCDLCGPWFCASHRATLNLMAACGHLPSKCPFLPMVVSELGKRRPHHAVYPVVREVPSEDVG